MLGNVCQVPETSVWSLNYSLLAMPRVETRASENKKGKYANTLNEKVHKFLGLPLCIILMLSRHCNIIKAIIRAVCVALGQLIMASLAKQFAAPQILSIMKREKLGTYLLKSLTSTPLWWESIHKAHTGTIGHCDVTIAGGCFIYRWCHNR